MPLIKKWQLDDHKGKPDIHHRKWGWADEQGWRKSFIIPFADDWTRYANNPILEGTAGEWDGGGEVIHPCVVRHNGTYYMFYAGKSWLDEKRRVGLASSTDPLGQSPAFSKYENNPIWEPPAGYKNCYMPSVIYDHYETDSNEKWKAWICFQTTGGSYETRFYTAPNPTGPWTLQGTCTGLTNYQYCNSVNKLGLLYHMAYVDTDFNVRAATSNDGLNWNHFGVILSHGSAGEWDDFADAYLSLFWNLGVWYLVYGGAPSGVTHFQIGMATNGDGWSPFTKFHHNPVYSYGSAGAWDEKHVYFPSLIMVEDKFYMYYCGCNNNYVYKIGVATIR